MPNILSNLNNKGSENSKFKFISTLVLIFIVFGAIGYFVVVLFASPGNPEDGTKSKNMVTSSTGQSDSGRVSYKGTVKYVDPNFYPNEKISFVLNDKKGKEVILLKADDQKLEVAEGHYVTAKGIVYNSEYGDFDYLLVDEVVIENVAN